MDIEKVKSWPEFKKRLSKYLNFTLDHRKTFYFRGHGSSDWTLKPTIDRLNSVSFSTDSKRRKYLTKLVVEFRESLYGLPYSGEFPSDTEEEEWEYLARHHGLPTTVLDWTQSPYIASYFAFEDIPTNVDHVSIWVLQGWMIDWDSIEGVKRDKFERTIRFNIRSAEQRAVSIRVQTITESFEKMLGDALLRFDVPSSERRRALAELDEMGINRRMLFRDADSAARTASIRLGAE